MINQYKDKVNWKRVLWLIITSKRFRAQFEGLIFYALINYAEKRGECASDVLMFSDYYANEIISTN